MTDSKRKPRPAGKGRPAGKAQEQEPSSYSKEEIALSGVVGSG